MYSVAHEFLADDFASIILASLDVICLSDCCIRPSTQSLANECILAIGEEEGYEGDVGA
jgi:hypothetical protein